MTDLEAFVPARGAVRPPQRAHFRTRATSTHSRGLRVSHWRHGGSAGTRFHTRTHARTPPSRHRSMRRSLDTGWWVARHDERPVKSLARAHTSHGAPLPTMSSDSVCARASMWRHRGGCVVAAGCVRLLLGIAPRAAAMKQCMVARCRTCSRGTPTTCTWRQARTRRASGAAAAGSSGVNERGSRTCAALSVALRRCCRLRVLWTQRALRDGLNSAGSGCPWRETTLGVDEVRARAGPGRNHFSRRRPTARHHGRGLLRVAASRGAAAAPRVEGGHRSKGGRVGRCARAVAGQTHGLAAWAAE
jgi:hypothetical protein